MKHRRMSRGISLEALLVVGVLSALAQGAEDGKSRVDCFQEAQSKGLSETDAIQLCDAASSRAPVDCFEMAQTAGFLSDVEAIRLCSYAATTAPAKCLQRAREKLILDTQQIVELCRPSDIEILERAGCAPGGVYGTR